MTAFKYASYFRLQFNWHADISTELLQWISILVIIFARFGVCFNKITIGEYKFSYITTYLLESWLNIIQIELAWKFIYVYV